VHCNGHDKGTAQRRPRGSNSSRRSCSCHARGSQEAFLLPLPRAKEPRPSDGHLRRSCARRVYVLRLPRDRAPQLRLQLHLLRFPRERCRNCTLIPLCCKLKF
jgi:hypothetical protein